MSNYKLQPLVNLVNITAKLGVKHAVLSPGSRCAPLAIGFVRHPDITAKTISDERSAGFIAFGMAQQTQNPTVLVCTSGTAALNYAPSVTEAYYQQVPLIVITADRPDEWIDQLDGQTIRQRNIFENHIKKSYHLPVDYTHKDAQWQIGRCVSEAVNLANTFPKGPVHINVPIREPFYPEKDDTYNFDFPVKIIEEESSEKSLSPEKVKSVKQTLNKFSNILLVAGQNDKNKVLAEALTKLPYPVCTDIISNLSYIPNGIHHQDAFMTLDKSNLQPDLLITFGKSVMSKSLKVYLRNFAPKEHWHIQEAGEVADTFQCLTKVWRVTPEHFFQQVNKVISREDTNSYYMNLFRKYDNHIREEKTTFFAEKEFSEMEAVNGLLNDFPEDGVLHLANSMSVRYANMLNLYQRKDVAVFANRGSSGIDGCTSTMVGHSLVTDRTNVLITGDLAFFYDRNAFWNKYLKANQKVLLLNNQGGVIFRMIDGPARQPELEEFFETEQTLTAEHLAKENNIAYFSASTREEFERELRRFLAENAKPCIFEVKTDKQLNKEVYQAFKALGSN